MLLIIALNYGSIHSDFTVFNVIVCYDATEFREWLCRMLLENVNVDWTQRQFISASNYDVILCDIGYI